MKNWRKYLSFIGIAIFIYILIKINIIRIFNVILKTNLSLLLLSICLLPLFLFFQTFKWFVIARKQKIEVPFKEAFKINLIGNFYGFITPSKIGNIIRADYLKRYGSLGKGITNFILDKFLDVSSVFFLAIFFSFIFRKELSFIPLNFFIFLFIILVCGGFLFLNKKVMKFSLGIFYRKLVPKNLKEKAKLSFNSFYDNLPKKRYFPIFFIFNLITWIFTYYITFIIGRSLGINLSFIYFLAILPIGTLVALIPITINGLGTREATLITLFSLFGIAPEKTFSLSMLAIIINILPSLAGIFFTFED